MRPPAADRLTWGDSTTEPSTTDDTRDATLMAMNRTTRGVPVFLAAISILVLASGRVRADMPRKVGPAEVAGATSDPLQDLGSDAAERLKKVLRGVFAFRQLAIGDYRKALSEHATEETRKKFESLDRHIWPAISPLIGWSFFMNLSVLTVSGAQGTSPLVAFYHPWTDLYLVTQWETRKGEARMVDAEILMGDWIRNKGKPPFAATPAWLRSDIFRPAALGIAAAEAVKAFEDVFPVASAVQAWRERLSLREHEEALVRYNYAVAAYQLLANLIVIDEYRVAVKEEDPSLTSLRDKTAKVLKLAVDGKMKGLLKSADETLPEVQKILLKMPGETFKTLRVVYIVAGKDASLVFLAPLSNPDYCISFLLKGKAGRQTLKRIDLVYYKGIYKNVTQKVSSLR